MHRQLERLGVSFSKSQLTVLQRHWQFAHGATFAVRPLTTWPDFVGQRQDYSLSAWVKTTVGGTVVAKTTPGSGRWVAHARALFIAPVTDGSAGAGDESGRADGVLQFRVGGVGALHGTTIVTDGQWHHLALTYKAAAQQYSLHVDGRREASHVLSEAETVMWTDEGPDRESFVVKLGFCNVNFPKPSALRASVREVSVWRRALSGAELAVLAQALPLQRSATVFTIVGANTGGEARARLQLLVMAPHTTTTAAPQGPQAVAKIVRDNKDDCTDCIGLPGPCATHLKISGKVSDFDCCLMLPPLLFRTGTVEPLFLAWHPNFYF